MPTPDLEQTGSAEAASLGPFQSDQILWFDHGIWGQAGYAVYNPSTKTSSSNGFIVELQNLIGRTMFELAHRQDVKFHVAPHYKTLYDLHQAIVVGRKRLADETRMPNDKNGLDQVHVNPIPEVFLAFPVPLMGERIRQPDIRSWVKLGLHLQSEICQHSDNDRVGYVTPQFSFVVGQYLQEILAKMAMKYFGKTREEAYKPDFILKDEDFKSYDPSKVMTNVEMTEERPAPRWWPTENDLSAIRGIPVNVALKYARSWPDTAWRTESPLYPFPNLQAGGAEQSAQAAAFVKQPGGLE